MPNQGRFLTADPFPGILPSPRTQHPYVYVANNPILNTDPTGMFTPWDILDVGSFLWSLSDFYYCPTWANFGWLALDVIGLLPIIPSIGLIGKLGKIDDILKITGKTDEIGQIIRLLPSPSRLNYPLHHIFPQRADLAARFAAQGIDISKHMMELPIEIHKKIHSSGPRGGLWNEAWEVFFKSNPGATATEIYKHAGWLIHEFGLEGVGRLIR